MALHCRFAGRPILTALLAGKYGSACEGLRDEEVVGGCLALLKDVFGAEKVPEPTASVVTRWGQGTGDHYRPPFFLLPCSFFLFFPPEINDTYPFAHA